MSYRDWQIGDKIVCIDDKPPRNFPRVGCYTTLTEGRIYVLESILHVPMRGGPTDVFVDVSGIRRASPNEPNFWATRFRKLNKPDEAKGSKEDFRLLMKNHASKPLALPAPVKEKEEEKVK